MNTLVSSANNIRFNRLEALLMSLMYSKKNRGPRIEPWETPQEISFLNARWPFYSTYGFLSSPTLSHEYRNVWVYQKRWHDLQRRWLWRGQEKYLRKIHLSQRPWRSYHASRLARVQWNDFSWSRIGYYRGCWRSSDKTIVDNSFKEFWKAGKYRDRSVVGEKRLTIRF